MEKIDRWLASEPDCPTYPELIPAICLGEENVSTRNPVLERIARHVREQYGIPVFQWYSEPLPPDVMLTADGWIWDSYGWSRTRFRKHAMKFSVLRKPVICVPWATDPFWPGGPRYESTLEMIDAHWNQFDVCREFDISCAAFAVAGETGSVATWCTSQAPEMIVLRESLAAQRARMHAVPAGELPTVDANYSARDGSVQVGTLESSTLAYEEDFCGFQWIHDASISGFMNLRLASQPDQPGFLDLIPEHNGPAESTLTYRCESWFPIERVEVSLETEIVSRATNTGTVVSLSLSANETEDGWPRIEEHRTAGASKIQLVDDDVVRGLRAFYLKVHMSKAEGKAGELAARLNHLKIRCIHESPGESARAELIADDYGNVRYHDNFRSERWKHIGDLKTDHPGHGGFRDGYFWVGLKGGVQPTVTLTQRFSSLKPLSQLLVSANAYADEQNLAGHVRIRVLPRGADFGWSTISIGRLDGPIELEIPPAELQGLQEFDVQIELLSRSGVEQGDKACARLHELNITAKEL